MIRWLVHVTEQDVNLNAENIIDRFSDLEKEHEQLKISTKREIRGLKKNLARVKKERDEMFSNLRRMSEKVVPPLVEQVAIYEKENIKLRSENQQL